MGENDSGNGSAKDLRLNSIARYQKQSPEYVLEEHSHCEVPAGCGGVVLRWRNPHRTVPVEMWMYSTGSASFFLDGAEPPSGRTLVTYGEHVLCWTIEDFDPTAAILVFSGAFDTSGVNLLVTPPAARDGNPILTAADGSWRYTYTPPADDEWMRPAYDDTSWLAMVARPITPPDEKAYGAGYRLKRLQALGAEGLGVVGAIPKVWIRRRFTLAEQPA